MKIDISFEAAQILDGTSLKVDEPEVWTRYLNNRTIRFGRVVGARVMTHMGHRDLALIRDYFCLWLHNQELIPDELREADNRSLMIQANMAIGELSRVIGSHTCTLVGLEDCPHCPALSV